LPFRKKIEKKHTLFAITSSSYNNIEEFDQSDLDLIVETGISDEIQIRNGFIYACPEIETFKELRWKQNVDFDQPIKVLAVSLNVKETKMYLATEKNNSCRASFVDDRRHWKDTSC
jgi:hypothetical protein